VYKEVSRLVNSIIKVILENNRVIFIYQGKIIELVWKKYILGNLRRGY